jgi:DNA-damage-inducible protein J
MGCPLVFVCILLYNDGINRRKFMSRDQISVRIDHATKAAAENVFSLMGLSATDAIRMFYRQVVLHHGLPFPAKIPNNETLEAFHELDNEQGKRMTLQEFKSILEKAGA